MTLKEYKEYQANVAAFFEREGVTNLSSDYGGGGDVEPYFSWSPCDCCGSHLGGDREDATGWNPTTNEVREYSVCVDCIYYAEYGQLDDMTMQEIDS